MKISARVGLSRPFCPILILLLNLSLFPGSGSGTETAKENTSERRALEKSLLFPGWGQIHEKQYFKGVIFSLAEAAAITSALIHNRKGNKSYINYKRAASPDAAAFWRNETGKFDRKRNAFMLAGAAVWIINLADIYLYRKKKRDKGIKISLAPGIKNEVSFFIAYRF